MPRQYYGLPTPELDELTVNYRRTAPVGARPLWVRQNPELDSLLGTASRLNNPSSEPHRLATAGLAIVLIFKGEQRIVGRGLYVTYRCLDIAMPNSEQRELQV